MKQFLSFTLMLLFIQYENAVPFKTEDEAKKYIKENHLTCGKNNPKNKNDCIKYGTDSDFYCCYFESENFCGLMSYSQVTNPKGNKQFAPFSDTPEKKIYCSQTYEKLSLIFLLICTLFLF